MAAYVHALALVGADGVSAAAFRPFAETFFALLPGMAVPVAEAIDTGRYEGAVDNLRMEAAGIAHILEAAHARRIESGPLAAVHAIFTRAIAAGHGADTLASIVDVVRTRR